MSIPGKVIRRMIWTHYKSICIIRIVNKSAIEIFFKTFYEVLKDIKFLKWTEMSL